MNATFQSEIKNVCTELLCLRSSRRVTVPHVSALFSQQKYGARCVRKHSQTGASSFLSAANRPNLTPALQTLLARTFTHPGLRR